MGRGLENKIPAYTLILFLCLPVDVSELKLWTYTPDLIILSLFIYNEYYIKVTIQ
jgi:hypothetical protein